MKQIFAGAIFGLVACAGVHVAAAQTSPAPAPSVSPTLAPSPSPSPKLLQFSGFADVGYTSRTGDTTTQFANGAPSRVFDYDDRNPDLQNLNVALALTAGNLAGKLELSSGTDADIIQSWPGAFNGFDVTQAYLGYTLGKLNAIVGKFETLAGAEVIESPSDVNFSRSILFGFAVPFTHTGGRLTYALNPHVNVIGGVNAGWDEVRSTNGRLTAEYGAAYTPSAAAELNVQGYTGYEQLANYTTSFNPLASQFGLIDVPASPPVNSMPSGAQGQRTLLDIVGSVSPNAALKFTLNYDHGFQQNAIGFTTDGSNTASWSGLAGYGTYTFNPRLSGTIRYEGFHDTDGYRTGFAQYWREGTATLAYNLTSAVTLRGEYRQDVSDHDVFVRTDGTTFGNTTGTIALEGLVKF